MPEQTLEGGRLAAERIRVAIEGLRLGYPMPGGERLLTTSAGVALVGRDTADDENGLMRACDAALYRAKRAGRNRVAVMPLLAERRKVAGERSRPA